MVRSIISIILYLSNCICISLYCILFFQKSKNKRRKEKKANKADFAQDVESDYAKNKTPRNPQRFEKTFKLGRKLPYLPRACKNQKSKIIIIFRSIYGNRSGWLCVYLVYLWIGRLNGMGGLYRAFGTGAKPPFALISV